MRAGNNGISADTVKNIAFGAGTIHKGLKYDYVLLKTEPTDFKTAYQKYYTRTGNEAPYSYTALKSAAQTFELNKYYSKGWNFEESCVGATKGGSSVKIAPEFYTVEPDGSSVAVKNFKRKIGETATMEANLLALTADTIKASVIGADGESNVTGYSLIESKEAIEEGD